MESLLPSQSSQSVQPSGLSHLYSATLETIPREKPPPLRHRPVSTLRFYFVLRTEWEQKGHLCAQNYLTRGAIWFCLSHLCVRQLDLWKHFVTPFFVVSELFLDICWEYRLNIDTRWDISHPGQTFFTAFPRWRFKISSYLMRGKVEQFETTRKIPGCPSAFAGTYIWFPEQISNTSLLSRIQEESGN